LSQIFSMGETMRSVWNLAIVVALAACGSKDHTAQTVPPVDPGTDNGGLGGTDDGGGATDDAQGIACGAISCKVGEYCCEGACGACTAIGTNCPPDPCPDAH
jgi:hypothetical protein